MQTLEIVNKLFQRDLTDAGCLEDIFQGIRLLEKEDFEEAHKLSKRLRNIAASEAQKQVSAGMLDVYHKTLYFDAPYDFESYLFALEFNRKPEEKFYQPRRKIMKRVVNALQRLTDGELKELFFSMPPRSGKSTILMFYATWLIGRESERSNLYVAYSDIITSAFYNGVLEILNDPVTYDWHNIFPAQKIVSTNAKDETLNIDRKKRYPSLTCRSLYGTLNGACDCNGVLISDDLIGGIEEALSKDRLMSAWSKVDNNMLPRAKENAKIVFCGTRWSLADPAGIRMDLLMNDEQFKNRKFEIINIPALDENDESNFNYDYGVGFSTEYYRQRRASFERNNDMASWQAQYMGEPIERSGALFEPEDMRFYNGVLPDEQPVRIFMACDPAFGGGDFTSAPVFYQYESGDVYVHDVVYNDGDKKITQPLIVNMIIKHKVQAAQFEANKMTMAYKDAIEQILIGRGYRLNITSRAAPNTVSKEQRIFDCAPEIRELYFLEDGARSKEYSLFMQNVFSFKMTGKNKHDDSVDSLAQGIDMIRGRLIGKAEVFRRPF